MLLGQTVGNLLAGFVADHKGHKFSLELSLWGLTIGFALAWLAPGPSWYFAVFFLQGMSAGIRIVSGILISLEFAYPEHRPSYVGIANTTAGIGAAIAPLVGGLLAWFGYDTLFTASALIGVAAFVAMHWGVVEPRALRLFDPVAAGD